MAGKEKKLIAVLTATRAEYGLLKTIIRKLSNSDDFEVNILVTGAHLSERQGFTCNEIIEDGFDITFKVDILTDEDTPSSICESMATAISGFSKYFVDYKPDALIVLGDRYETLAVCCCAMNFKTPIFHFHGGEITEGAVDDVIRHAITKLSLYHFTSTEDYRQRVIQLGEEPQRVFNVGALGIENIINEKMLSIKELSDYTGLDLDKPYVVVTYHPVTLENDCEKQIAQVLNAISKKSEYQFIITGANADCGGEIINKTLEEYAFQHDNVFFVHSLGIKRYLSALKYCSFVMGNSSSGIIEAPSFGIPTVNIGNRQQGRLRAESVIDCEPEVDSIVKAMEKAKQIGKGVYINPYGDGKTSDKIMQILTDVLLNNKLNVKKKFYDIEV